MLHGGIPGCIDTGGCPSPRKRAFWSPASRSKVCLVLPHGVVRGFSHFSEILVGKPRAQRRIQTSPQHDDPGSRIPAENSQRSGLPGIVCVLAPAFYLKQQESSEGEGVCYGALSSTWCGILHPEGCSRDVNCLSFLPLIVNSAPL